MKDWRIAGLGIGAVTLLEAIALMNGINGVMFTTSIAVIGGIAGFRLHDAISKRK